jgi:hypothetical protein
MPLDLSKPLRVRYLDGPCYEVIASIPMAGCLHVYWKLDGRNGYSQFGFDGRGKWLDATLENIPEKRIYERWVNANSNGMCWSYETREDADKASAHGHVTRIACLHIRHEYEEGEGL